MKKIITTVGTSIFKNAEVSKLNINGYKNIENKLYTVDEWNDKDNQERIQRIKKTILESDFINQETASAEIQTIHKITNSIEDKIILVTTDTFASNIAAEIIRDYFKDKHFPEPEIKRVNNLLVSFEHLDPEEKKNEKGKINSGFNELIKILDEIIKKERPENCILNISGGYKALIPFTTIIGQLYKVPLMYMYEDSNTLVTIDPMPINFDWSEIQQYRFYIDNIKKIDEIETLYKDEIKNALVKLSILDHSFNQTALGKIIELIYKDESHPDSKGTLGYFAEYKVYEYLIKHKQGFKVERTVSGEISYNGEKAELDIQVINEKEKTLNVVEVKSQSNANDLGKKIGKVFRVIKGKFQHTHFHKYTLVIYNVDQKLKPYQSFINSIELIKKECELNNVEFDLVWFTTSGKDYKNFLKDEILLNTIEDWELFKNEK